MVHPYLSKALVEARQNELLRQAEQHRLVSEARSGQQSWLTRWFRAARPRRFRRSAVGSADSATHALRPDTHKL